MAFFDDLKNSPTGTPRPLTNEERFLKEKDRLVMGMVEAVKGSCTDAHKKGIRALDGYFEFYIDEDHYGVGLNSCSHLDERIKALHNGGRYSCKMWDLKPWGLDKYMHDEKVLRKELIKCHFCVAFSKEQLTQFLQDLKAGLVAEGFPENCVRIISRTPDIPHKYNFFTGHTTAWFSFGNVYFIELNLRW